MGPCLEADEALVDVLDGQHDALELYGEAAGHCDERSGVDWGV